jgi:peptide/nickel transport system permease protein
MRGHDRPAALAAGTPKRSRLFSHPVQWIAPVIVTLYLIVALAAPVMAPYGETEIVGDAHASPTSAFPLGTDQIGRDMLSRMIFGTRNTIGIVSLITLMSFGMGSVLGVLAAMRGGWVDQVLSRAVDVLMAIPFLIFVLLLLAIFGKGMLTLVGILSPLSAIYVFRLVRAAALDVVSMEFLEVARLRRDGFGWIMLREILPNIAPMLAVEFGLRFCFVFLTISALSFLGVGLQPPTADWGSMVADGKALIIYGKLTPLIPAGAIVVLTIAVNLIVDSMLDGGGRHGER